MATGLLQKRLKYASVIVLQPCSDKSGGMVTKQLMLHDTTATLVSNNKCYYSGIKSTTARPLYMYITTGSHGN